MSFSPWRLRYGDPTTKTLHQRNASAPSRFTHVEVFEKAYPIALLINQPDNNQHGRNFNCLNSDFEKERAMERINRVK